MTTLTEQMKQGTLPNGNYWVMFNGDVTQMENYNGWFLNCEVPVEYEKIDEVLCECLTYEETIAMKDCARMLWAAAEREVKLKKLLRECCFRIDWTAKTGDKPTDDRKQKLFNDIDQVLKENNNA